MSRSSQAPRPDPLVAVYPGTFDPVTNGHLDIIRRGARLFDVLYVAVARNLAKTPLFTTEERVDMLRRTTAGLAGVRIESFDGLLVDFVARVRGQAILRGVRAVSDYEYELQMALMNRRLSPRVETIFLLPSEEHSFLSASLVKEVAILGGDVRPLVPPPVLDGLVAKIGDRRPHRHQATSPPGVP